MIVYNKEEGEISDDAIRYVLIRPDVLMGAAHQLPPGQALAFLNALEQSAFAHSRESFSQYKTTGRFGRGDFLLSAAEVAVTLGWGSWSVRATPGAGRDVQVRNSPFAQGFGRSDVPVCAPIRGVLRAIALVGYGDSAVVTETACAAQDGSQVCHFHLRLDGGAV
jgi:hypothetical protein